jgi:hypothetical protein
MTSDFLTNLNATLISGDQIWELNAPLIYYSELFGRVYIPAGFQTDLASVPRVPIIYQIWGGRSHHEAVVHDFCYRIGAEFSFEDANKIFLEAMKARVKSKFIRWPMYLGVCMGGKPSYHKRQIMEKLT